ncbi:hypothetical protein Scep_022170 [Stephania cephalantha]|uniref:Uncharacterized protein n=1 Tax=Stephania cephalantha TaxID=152367 RepID=A0AAP0F5W0_9MAGN
MCLGNVALITQIAPFEKAISVRGRVGAIRGERQEEEEGGDGVARETSDGVYARGDGGEEVRRGHRSKERRLSAAAIVVRGGICVAVVRGGRTAAQAGEEGSPAAAAEEGGAAAAAVGQRSCGVEGGGKCC